MSLLTDTWRGLVQRRLWPLALLLVAALAAVPFLLSEEPVPPSPVPTGDVAADKTLLASQPIVAAASAADREADRHVIGGKNDPFKPAPTRKAKDDSAASPSGQAASGTTVTVTGPSQSDLAPITGGGGTAGGFTPAPAPIAPLDPVPGTAPTPAPRKQHELYSLSVRWGDSAAETRPARGLNRLKALPSVADPVIIYLGVLEDEKTAVFMLDAKATTLGDGVCKPRPEDCQTVQLREGETAYFDVTDDEGTVTAQYQLDLLKIRRTTATAAKARAAEAKGGRELLRERRAQAASYEFDAERGVLETLAPKATEAKLARIARAVAAVAGV